MVNHTGQTKSKRFCKTEFKRENLQEHYQTCSDLVGNAIALVPKMIISAFAWATANFMRCPWKIFTRFYDWTNSLNHLARSQNFKRWIGSVDTSKSRSKVKLIQDRLNFTSQTLSFNADAIRITRRFKPASVQYRCCTFSGHVAFWAGLSLRYCRIRSLGIKQIS